MHLVKDTNPGAYAVRVRCVAADHDPGRPRMTTLAHTWADMEGRAFVDYYCDACVTRAGGSPVREG